ncbi:AEC family transporter [Limnobacter parvus]|uniref:AEC family transporter n=1 Tax=Limnobacter parvus TaxID=2939690 RepID=A0ABT1XIN7_9BURK|nr:AEC family transporter [Limnobacter parvus]MCR2747148.1 AEC family transporter [Limnobacter parvus]
MFLRIVAVIFPVFAVVALGYWYGRVKKPDMRFANQLNMEIFVPALVFSALASKSFDIETYWLLAVGGAIIVLGSGLLAWPIGRYLGIDSRIFVPPMMFNNSGNMGLPLAILAFGEHALPAAVMLFLVSNTLHYSLGTWMMSPNARILMLWKEPVIAASIAGLLVSMLNIQVWEPLYFAIDMIGDVSIPLLLFSLGVRLTQADFSDVKLGVIGGVLCPLTGLIFAALCVWLLPLTPEHAAMLIVFGALPPAVLSFVFAEKYGLQPQRVASLVMMGNLMSLIFVPLALYWVL